MLKYFLPLLVFLSACSQGSIVIIPKNLEPDYGMYIFEAPHGFEMFSDSGATRSIQDFYQSGTIVLNGSYFGLTHSGSYFPAGLWIEHSIQQYPIQTNDPNLSHVVTFHKYGNQLEIHKNAESNESIATCNMNPAGCFAFQAGPLVLSGNTLQDLGTSWHANGQHERTLLGLTKSGKIYFFIFSRPITLAEVGDIVRKDSRFTLDTLTLLNLDGGPSTAFFDGKNGFREDKKLPIVVHIK